MKGIFLDKQGRDIYAPFGLYGNSYIIENEGQKSTLITQLKILNFIRFFSIVLLAFLALTPIATALSSRYGTLTLGQVFLIDLFQMIILIVWGLLVSGFYISILSYNSKMQLFERRSVFDGMKQHSKERPLSFLVIYTCISLLFILSICSVFFIFNELILLGEEFDLIFGYN